MSYFHDYLQKKQATNTELKSHASPDNQLPHYQEYTQYVTILCQYSGFRFTGSDLMTYLQGQLCGDVRQLTPNKALFTAHCSPKGRVIGTLLLHTHHDGSVHAWLPSSGADALVERLQKYILFSKVSISPLEGYIAIECSGSKTQEALQAWIPELPDEPLKWTHQGSLTCIQQPGDNQRWLLLTDDDHLAVDIWEALIPTHSPIGPQQHTKHLIEAGVCDISSSTSEAFLPQMIGLDNLGGLSLKKGCYVGQEVIARTSHLGQLKRHLYRFSSDSPHQSQSNDSITDEKGSILGRAVTTHTDKKENRIRGLAVIASRGIGGELFFCGQRLCEVKRIFED